MLVFSVGCKSTGIVPPNARATTSCPQIAGARMVMLPVGYCVDATEVTRAAYAAWLETEPDASNQIPACSWNASFVPYRDWPSHEADTHLPVTWVDWCDAYAYCKAVGKRLCGKPLPRGETRGYARHSQLYAACSSNDTYQYSYGNAYEAAACNTAEAGNGRLVAVATMKRCQSPMPGYAGAYDLSGNVWEWEDDCFDRGQQGGKATFCILRGGSYSLIGEFSRCGRPQAVSRNNPGGDIGFRCCAP
jgi:formylglycine-generating enzyme required for sulfatase activity